jgi:hypothetical protein
MLVPRKRTHHGTARRMPRPQAALASLGPAALGVLAAVVVAACGSSAAPAGHAAAPSSRPSSGSSGKLSSNGAGLCGSATQVDSLTVQRTNALPSNHTRFAFPATETVSDPARAQAVAQSLCGLQRVPRTVVACPADFGITYKLTFSAGAQRFTPVTLDAGGCQLVGGLGGTRRVATSSALWRYLGVAIGIPHPNSATFSGQISNQ